MKFHAVLAGARIPMQVDIGFGDAVYPEPEFASFPVLLPMEPPVIRAYPREAAIAEKLNAMVVLDIRNSRMKEFYDIWFMANTWTFEMATLRDAKRSTPQLLIVRTGHAASTMIRKAPDVLISMLRCEVLWIPSTKRSIDRSLM